MKKFCMSYFFTITAVFSLLIAPLPLSAMVQESFGEAHDTYICLGQDLSNIGDIITHIKDLDDSDNSPLNGLHEYIKDGFLVGEYDAVLEALIYAETVVEKKSEQL